METTFSARKASPWLHQEDAVVMDRHFSAACYIEHAFPVTLYLAWKYADDFEAGLMANTHLGGDNYHRRMVMGALIGAAVGKEGIPGPWIRELKAHQALAALTKRTTGDAPMDHDQGILLMIPPISMAASRDQALSALNDFYPRFRFTGKRNRVIPGHEDVSRLSGALRHRPDPGVGNS